MKKLLLTLSTMGLALLLLTGGIFAYQYLTFTGDDQIEQADADVNEILQILEEVAVKGEMTEQQLEDAKTTIKELQDMNPAGLAKQNKELRNQVAQLNTDLSAKQKEIDEKNTAYDALHNERDQIATARDNAIAERDNIQAQYNTLNENHTQLQTELAQANEEIERLQGELQRANEAVENHAGNVNAAVEKARTYKE